MAQYLEWLEQAFPSGFVSAKGHKFAEKSKTVRCLFQLLLGWAALASLGLLVLSVYELIPGNPMPNQIDAAKYYDDHALALADEYELIEFELAYPFLVSLFRENEGLSVLDVGAGTGRDAAWIAQFGHNVVAVEPSEAMRLIGQKIHPSEGITWVDDRLPYLPKISENTATYDVILLNAVWMHIDPSNRMTSLTALSNLLTSSGELYISLRLGPENDERSIYKVTSGELEELANVLQLEFELVGEYEDLLGRTDIRWQFVKLSNAS